MVHLASTVVKRYQVKHLGSIRTPPAPSVPQQPPFLLIIRANYPCKMVTSLLPCYSWKQRTLSAQAMTIGYSSMELLLRPLVEVFSLLETRTCKLAEPRVAGTGNTSGSLRVMVSGATPWELVCSSAYSSYGTQHHRQLFDLNCILCPRRQYPMLIKYHLQISASAMQPQHSSDCQLWIIGIPRSSAHKCTSFVIKWV